MTPGDLPCLWLTTLRADGSPHTTPVWFALDDETVWVATSRQNIKVRNILRDDRVSMAIDQTGPAPWVAEGRAVVYSPIDRVRHARHLAALTAKYGGWDPTDSTQDGPRVLLEIPVTRWLLTP